MKKKIRHERKQRPKWISYNGNKQTYQTIPEEDIIYHKKPTLSFGFTCKKFYNTSKTFGYNRPKQQSHIGLQIKYEQIIHVPQRNQSEEGKKRRSHKSMKK